MSRRIYQAGELIIRPGDAVEAIARGEYLVVHGRPTHPGWAGSWQVNMLAATVRRGFVHAAILTPYGEKVMADRKAKRDAEEEELVL